MDSLNLSPTSSIKLKDRFRKATWNIQIQKQDEEILANQLQFTLIIWRVIAKALLPSLQGYAILSTKDSHSKDRTNTFSFSCLSTALLAPEEFFYDQVPEELKSVGIALYLSLIGVGNFLSSFLISFIVKATAKYGHDSWFSDNLNRAYLDYFYLLLF
uniref:Protein NRT1/ PTR FAMILY 5.10-like n=1 Tax=Nicotiana tabacum TaxID=4097 RepID=A0A1S3ZJM5_TOBAC|nr:PREDICTED: uncharacterized protein LOC107787632 [Nicotiana tabacum]